MMNMNYTPTIVTGAERSVAQLRLIFERAIAPVDVRMPVEPVQIQEPVVAVEPVSEPEPALDSTLEPTLELKHETETEIVVVAAVETAVNSESEYEVVRVRYDEPETASIVDDGAKALDDERFNTQDPQNPTSEAGSEYDSNVAVAPMPRQESNAAKTRSQIRPPQVTRPAPRLASTPLHVNTRVASTPTAAPEVRATPRTTRQPKSNEQELARARQWRENKKALDSRVAAAKSRYMEYATSSRYIAHREASVAQRQQSTRTNGTTRATTTTRRSSA